jgi:hypothetical protein
MRGSLIKITTFVEPATTKAVKGRTAIAVKKAFPTTV